MVHHSLDGIIIIVVIIIVVVVVDKQGVSAMLSVLCTYLLGL